MRLFILVLLVVLCTGTVVEAKKMSGQVGVGKVQISYEVVKAGGKEYTPECFECDLPIAITYSDASAKPKPLKIKNLAKGYFKEKHGKESVGNKKKTDKIKFDDLEILVNESYQVQVPIYGWIPDGGNCSKVEVIKDVLRCYLNSTYYYEVPRNGTGKGRVFDSYTETSWKGSKWGLKGYRTETKYRWTWRPVSNKDVINLGDTVVVNYHLSRPPDAGLFVSDFIPQVSINGILLDFSNLAWFNASWEKVMLFNVTAPPTTEDAVYKLVIDGTTWTLYNATGAVEATATSSAFWSLVQADGDDLRIANESNEIYWWRESWDYTNQKTTIWIKLPAGSEMIKVVYGNDDATATSYENRNQVFVLYDDFEDQDISDWTIDSGSWSITTDAYEGSYALHKDTLATLEIISKAINLDRTTDSIKIELYYKLTEDAGTTPLGFLLANSPSGSGYLFLVGRAGTASSIYTWNAGALGTQLTSAGTGITANTWYKATIIVKSDGTLYFADGTGAEMQATDTTYMNLPRFHLRAARVSVYDLVESYDLDDPADFLNGHELPVAKPPTDPTNITFNRTAYYVGNVINATASGSTDPEGVGVTYYYNFTVNGVEKQTWSTDNTYKITVDDAHAQIMVCAKAYNGYRFSNATCVYIPPDGYVQNTPPVVTSYDTDKGSYAVGENITATMTATDADNDALTYEYKFEDITAATILQNWSTNNTYTITAAEQDHTIRVWFRAYDGYNYSSEVYKDVVVARATPPQIINVSPAPPITIYESTITFSAEINQTADCEWILNGVRQEWDNATTTPSFTYTFSAGNYTLQLIAHNRTLPSLTDSYTWQISVSVQPTPAPETYRILKNSSLTALLLASLAAFMLILFGLVAYIAGKSGSGAAILIVSVIIFVMVMFGLWAATYMFKLAGWT